LRASYAVCARGPYARFSGGCQASDLNHYEHAAMSGQRVQRLNRDGLAKASRPSPLSSTSGIRVARRGRRRPRPRIAKDARPGGRWPKRAAPPQLRRASGARPGRRPEHADSTKVIHVLSRPLSFVPSRYSRTSARARRRRLLAPSRVTPSRPAISQIVRSSHFVMGRRKRLDRIDQVYAQLVRRDLCELA
jgi:hypothetical protein